MKLVEGVREGVTVIEVHGRIDGATGKEFGERLLSLMGDGCSALVVDLQNVAYISSAGFHALLLANRAAAEKQGKLVLCGLTSEVKRLFDIGAFTSEFLICPSQAEGIGKLRQ
jgi:anti-sigma B factor antagonist